MATQAIIVDSTVYVEVSTTGTALVTNEGSDPVRIMFNVSLPAVGVSTYLTLQPNQGLQQNANLPVGNIYARAHTEGRTSKVTVS